MSQFMERLATMLSNGTKRHYAQDEDDMQRSEQLEMHRLNGMYDLRRRLRAHHDMPYVWRSGKHSIKIPSTCMECKKRYVLKECENCERIYKDLNWKIETCNKCFAVMVSR